MKTLFLLRHGKAEAFAPGGDEDRELTERGVGDVQTIAANVAALGGRPDLIVSSGARRARRTAELVGEFGVRVRRRDRDRLVHL